MNHARVKALKGDGKTVSRKAIKSGRASNNLSPHDSPIASLLTSPRTSKPPSRVTSDVSDGSGSEPDAESDDEMLQSLYSDASGASAGQDGDKPTVDIQAIIEQLRDRKHNNEKTREQLLDIYVKALRLRFSHESLDWLSEGGTQLADIFLRDANRGPTARERLLSLKAYQLTVMTAQDIDVFDAGQRRLKQIILDEDDDDCKEHAIYALALTALYAGGGEESAADLMEYLVEIVQSDGQAAEAYDSSHVVLAAMRAWSWLAAHVDDYSSLADSAMDAFVDQLDSASIDVQAVAGECIALIYEASRAHESETGQPFQLPYDPRRLAGRVDHLAKQSTRSVARSNRRTLRETLRGVVTSLERSVGPGYSTAEDPDGRPYGYRQYINLGSSAAPIETWSLLARWNMLKLVFKSGVVLHALNNPTAMECIDDASFTANDGAWKRNR
ncbi:hypothetical protein NLU13_4517 [Sarocladium strictum]|uniref:Interferon-related developmental regulator N-terminal domain-containing protein n=1 Tax=Sarocladium strictum TaxID=5046 RepID=A0AA39GLL6_SARSR|nr:hypothetical protein NLU13_4517 [Sarocladium strictum]